MKILAIIPARSGSKGIPDKNIRKLGGKPMIAYSIEQAKASKMIDRVIVSTDSESYAEIARSFGAETPFIRPREFAQDDSLDIDVFYHALSWLRDNEAYAPDICVHLRPCNPVRNPEVMDKAIQRFIDNPNMDSLRAVSSSSETPYKAWLMPENNYLIPAMKDIAECYNMTRQQLPQTYFQNGYIDLFRPCVVLERRSMTGDIIGGYVVDEYFDIDYEDDLVLTETCLNIRNECQSFLIDADGILNDEFGNVINSNMDLLNRLRSAGHKVLIRCKGKGIKERLLKLGIAEASIVDGFVETDYYISKNNVSMAALRKILC